MADLTALFGILILLALSYPCLLAADWFLFPGAVERARLRLEKTPGRSFWLGLAAALLALIPILILLNLPFGPAKFLGWVCIAFLLGLASIGGAAWAARLGEKLFPAMSGARSILIGGLVTELAAVFPLLGWLAFFPYSLLSTLGAALFALLRWMPGQAKVPVAAPAIPEAAPAGQQS
jgi:hypothetical protein